MMHILILPSWYKTEQNPVLGSFFEEQARALRRRGHNVGILFPQFIPFSSHKKGFQRVWDDDGLPTLECYVKALIPRSRVWNYRYLSRQALRMFRSYVQIHGWPDLLHAHSVYYGAIVGKYIAEKTGIPIIHTEHRVDFDQKHLHATDLQIAQEVFLAMNQNLLVSSTFKAELPSQVQVSSDHFDVLHNIVNPIFLKGFIPTTRTVGTPFRFFTTSFLSPRKNHKLMLQALAEVVQEQPEVELYIGGQNLLPDHDVRAELEVMVKELQLNRHVHFLGHLSRGEVLEQMQACHAFVLGSTFETFGVVLIEAMAVGRPVVSTDSKGPRDIINSQNGILVRDWSPEAFANAMLTIMEQYDRYDQYGISTSCAQRFGEDIIMSRLESHYQAIL